MPTTLGGFKEHPLTALADAPEHGTFRGESVYSRSQVLHLKAAENWMRSGCVVCAGEQPLKYVKQRAVTLSRRRELEFRRVRMEAAMSCRVCTRRGRQRDMSRLL
ncbi:hypothetical protein EDB85DRAFT_1983079 [Lactarius pseudohatsudake]|nr:hypothetical protein EDB85DRAFT_1983079 [Lactarius pseudohatsudake]